MPQNLDLSTNAWQQLVFWEAFAAAFSYQGTNAFQNRPSIRDYGFRMDDPRWFTYADEAKGCEFAYKALSLRTGGMSFTQLVEWVGANYTNNGDHRYCEDSLQMFEQILSAKRN